MKSCSLKSENQSLEEKENDYNDDKKREHIIDLHRLDFRLVSQGE